MTSTCYVTFGQKYRHEVHPIDRGGAKPVGRLDRARP